MCKFNKLVILVCLFKFQLVRSNLIVLKDTDVVTFRHNNSDGYSNILRKNQFIYLSGSNYVFKLNSLNISDRSEEIFIERSIFPTIDQNVNATIQRKSKNYVKFLVSRDLLNDFIICGTNLGRPHLYDLKEPDLSNQLEYNGNYLCPGLNEKTSLGLISYDFNYSKYQSMKKGIMFSAVWQASYQSDNPFDQYGIYRKEIEFNRHFLKSHASLHWLWDPHFIYMLEDGAFVYYFFNEFSIEEFKEKYPNFDLNSIENKKGFAENVPTPRYSRVARVCKNDKGLSSIKYSFLNNLWSSFRKIKMECSCDNRSALFNKLTLLKAYSNRIFAIFHQELNSKSISTDHSVLCEFDLKDLRQQMTVTEFWQSDSNEKKFKHDIFKCDQNLDEELLLKNSENDTIFYSDSDENSADDFHLFLSENTIIKSKLAGTCRLVLPFKIVSMAISKSFIYLSTSDNKLVQINLEENYEIHCSIDLSLLSSIRNVNEMLVNEENSIIYLATFNAVYQLDIARLTEISCNQNEYCSACVTQKYCHWNTRSTPSCFSSTEPSAYAKICDAERTEYLVLDEYQTVVLKCGRFSEKLSSQVRWRKDKMKITSQLEHYLSNRAELILINVKSNVHSGVYSCETESEHILKKMHLTISNRSSKATKDNQYLDDQKSIELLQKSVDESTVDFQDVKLKLGELESLINKNEC